MLDIIKLQASKFLNTVHKIIYFIRTTLVG